MLTSPDDATWSDRNDAADVAIAGGAGVGCPRDSINARGDRLYAPGTGGTTVPFVVTSQKGRAA